MTKNLYMDQFGKRAKIASNKLSNLSIKKRNEVLELYCYYLKKYSKQILKFNKRDILASTKIKSSMIERLKLSNKKINQIRKSLIKIKNFKDPLGKNLSLWKRPNGLIIKKISIPIGVIGVIYESRPNVTSDVSALCFKSGNAVILRGGSEAIHSNRILVNLFRKALKNKNCDKNCVQLIESKNRSNVDYLLSNMKKYIDIIVPRGGKSLVKKVQEKSKVPTIGHLEGICHVYVDSKADLNIAIKVVKNAKMRNFNICGAAETLLIDKKCLKTHCEPILLELYKSKCKIIGDNIIKKNFSKKIKIAKSKDWDTEYLSPIISVKFVKDVKEAIKHINQHGSNHTDAIITSNKRNAELFLNSVDSSIVMHNTSTQFADGGEFGMGAEIGISTGRLHARGPVGANQLTSFKYIVRGSGQTRKV